jgi:hypothetical protein
MDAWDRVIGDLIARVDGPLHFRLIVQPVMAIWFAIRDGRQDARLNRPAYLWDMAAHPSHAKDQFKSALKAVAKIIGFGLVMDAIYQAIELHWFYPGEAILVVIFVAVVPYILVRGPANRITRWLRR